MSFDSDIESTPVVAFSVDDEDDDDFGPSSKASRAPPAPPKTRAIQVKPHKTCEWSSGDEKEETDNNNGTESLFQAEQYEDSSHKTKTTSKRKSSKKKKQQDAQPISAQKSSPAFNGTGEASRDNSWPGDMTGIFEIEGHTSDVVLDKLGISWSSVEISVKSLKKKKSKKKEASEALGQQCDHLCFEDILGVKIKRERKGKQMEGEGVCLGMAIQSFDKKETGRFKQRLLMFGSPSEDVCLKWARQLTYMLEGFVLRPKKIVTFLQPNAGKMNSRSIYQKEILPLFDMAGIADTYLEVNHNEHIKQELIHLDLALYDCIVCVGGDGTVTKVMNGLMNRTQKDQDICPKPGFKPVQASLPLGIIPTGTMNQICHTVQGIEDPVTAAIHIIRGHTVESNLCSVSTPEKFHGWAFNCHYGFFGTVLPLMKRYSVLGEKKVEAGFMKALTKSKFRGYECDVYYLPPEGTNGANSCEDMCRQGCRVCDPSPADDNHNGPVFDSVQVLQPLEDSQNSSTFEELAEDGPWKSLKGEILNVSVLSTPALSDFAPLGMSKYGHRNDGVLDLIITKYTDKKEFLRFLKRHGNSKNQLSLPFVEHHRCQEVRFHTRVSGSWDHPDFEFNEILDEVSRRDQRVKQGLHRAESIEVIDDLAYDLEDSEKEDEDIEEMILSDVGGRHHQKGSDENSSRQKQGMKTPSGRLSSREQRPPTGSSRSFCTEEGDMFQGYINHNFVEEEEDVTKRKLSIGNKKRSPQGSAESRKRSIAQEKLAQNTNVVLNVTSDYNPTIIEKERSHRMKTQRRKQKKKKLKEEAKSRTVWNLDNETETELNLHFKVHQGLVRLFGEGVPTKHSTEDLKMGCLGLF